MTSKKIKWTYTTFEKHLDRKGFSCGVPALDNYIQTQASQDIKNRVCQIYVAVDPKNPTTILGYYALSSGQVAFQNFPEGFKKKLPKYPIPVVRIGRLAVNRIFQGLGLGKSLLMHALTNAVRAGEVIGIAAVVVDAKDDKAKAFYLKYGFIPFIDNPLKLFLPIQTIKNSIP